MGRVVEEEQKWPEREIVGHTEVGLRRDVVVVVVVQ